MGIWAELLITGAHLPVHPTGTLPVQAAVDGEAVWSQGDGNGFLIAGGHSIHLHVLSLFCHLSNSDSRGPELRVVGA